MTELAPVEIVEKNSHGGQLAQPLGEAALPTVLRATYLTVKNGDQLIIPEMGDKVTHDLYEV